MNKKVQAILNEAKDILNKQGLEGYDLIFSGSKSLNIKSAQGKVDQYKVSQAQALGFRVITDNKVGISYTEDLSTDSLKKAVDWAADNARNSNQMPEEKIQDPSGMKESDYYHVTEDGFIDSEKNEEKLKFALSLESQILEKPKVKACPYNGFSEDESEVYYANSKSHTTSYKNFVTSCYTSALLEDNGKNSSHFDFGIARTMEELPTKKIIEESYLHAYNWLEGAPLETGDYDVLFTINSLASLFGRFSTIFSGMAAKEGTNPFFSRMGEKCFYEQLSIHDNPVFDQAYTKTYFDSEGFPVESLTLVENGTMSNLYHNSATANKLNCENTFRASRSAHSPLSVSGTNTVIEAGDEASVTNGLVFEIHELSGLHSGANPLSGDFAFGASGYLLKEGKIQQPVKNVTVAGNFFKMLSAIEGIGSEIKANSSLNFFSPDIRFSKLKIAGS